jgi:hypothetical protein
MMAYSIDGATDGAIQDILCHHTQNYEVGRFGISAPHISRACGGYQSILSPRNGMSERAVVRY